jgi:hypothetical protein
MQQSRMLFARPSLFSLLLFAIYSTSLISCSDDPEPAEEPSCLPTTAARVDGTFFDYYYDENYELTKIELRSGTSISTRYMIQYEESKIKHVLTDYVTKNEKGAKYELMYDTNGKPTELLIYTVQTDTEPYTRTEFTHDDAGRISTKKYFAGGIWIHTVRYEYTSNGNVQKMFITKAETEEYLASEFTSYDDKKRFFSASAELTLLELYLFDYEPSINNTLTQVMHADLSSVYDPAKQINFTMTYDQNNYVNSLQNETNFASNTILFSSMTYQCK